MAVHEIRIDPRRTLREEPGSEHNGWHADIPPVVRCEPGDEVVMETRDAFDGQMGPNVTLKTVEAREQAALERGDFVLPPSAESAVPRDPAIATRGLRTIPLREQPGNVEIKQFGAGTRLYVPVDTPGALFSAGDAHFAQGGIEPDHLPAATPKPHTSSISRSITSKGASNKIMKDLGQ